MPIRPASDDDQVPEYRCTNCRRLLFAEELNRFACFLCESRASKQIAELPHLYKQLSTVLTPGSTTSETGRVTSSRSAPLPVNLHVLDLLGPGGIASDLQAIEDSWRAARGRSLGPRTDGVRWFATGRLKSPGLALADHSVFIAYNLQWACESYEEIAFDLNVIREAHAKANTACSGHRRRRVAVACLAEYDDGTTCGAELKIDVAAAYTNCPDCGARWNRDDWVRLYEATRTAAA